jgi:PAS domain S-box-containing protein
MKATSIARRQPGRHAPLKGRDSGTRVCGADERDQLLLAAVEFSGDAIITKTPDGVITSWNPAAERLFGHTAQEAIGQPIQIIIPREKYDEERRILRQLNSGLHINHYETVRLTKDGRRLDISLSVSPVRSRSGLLLGATKIARDITKDRKEAAEKSRLLEILSNTFSSMGEAVVVANKDGTIIQANQAATAMLGISAGQSLFDRSRTLSVCSFDGEPIPLANLPLRRVLRGEKIENCAVEIRGKDFEKPLAIVVSGNPLRDERGNVVGGIAVGRDVTATLETERQLRQAQKLEVVGQLTGGIAHDFNNILTVVTGTMEMLAEGVADRPDLAEIVRMIDEAASRGADLTHRLLAFARKQALQPAATDVSALVFNTAKLLRPTLGANICIETILTDDAAVAFVDSAQLSTALLNLALNSRDAMPNGGKLTFEISNVAFDGISDAAHPDAQSKEFVAIGVSDCGAGIPAELQDRVFEPFFTTKGPGQGSGLGLSMVYGFVKQSGGHVKIRSEVGHGTTVTICLPRHCETGLPVAKPEDAPAMKGSETVLAVEDDRLVLRQVSRQLRSLGYKVLGARNATEALALVRTNADIDVIFTDVLMPGAMNGRQLAREATRLRADIKFVFTSGYAEDAIILHGLLDPDVLLLTKPYRKTDLARVIRRALKLEPADRSATYNPPGANKLDHPDDCGGGYAAAQEHSVSTCKQ